jgi:glutamate--cysteine ligase
LITPPGQGVEPALEFLGDAHAFVYEQLDDEILWATSMPCVLAGGGSIPIAQYGDSNLGRMKTVYRRGLGYRYGRSMQVISGVHFNYSFDEALWPVLQEIDGASGPLRDYIDAAYFALLRNLQRWGWIIPYLFGASPAVCKSFLHGKRSTLPEFDENTYYEPYATSLRMGDIGYTNTKEGETGIKACYDDLAAYVDSLARAIAQPYPPYEAIGVCVDGDWRQLNANILQIENEYYSTVRPKQPPRGNEKPSLALRRRGVRYVELRSLDVNAYHPLGVDARQLRFVEALMVYAMLADGPPISGDERLAIDQNLILTAHRGRQPGLRLADGQGGTRLLRDWARALCDRLAPICAVLDGDDPERPYSSSLAQQCALVEDPELTPSARMLAEMRANHEPFYALARRMSEAHAAEFRGRALSGARRDYFVAAADRSRADQAAVEAEPQAPFEQFLQEYFAQA